MSRPLGTILKQDVQRIFDNFSSCFNIRILFYSPKGEMLSVGLNRPNSSYCSLVQARLYGVESCMALDQTKRDEAARRGEMICYQCHAGLVEAIKPVFFEHRLLGFAVIGQFRSRESVPSEVQADWSATFPAEELDTAYAGLPFVHPRQVDHILGLFSILVDYIVMQNMVVVKGNTALEELIAYMESHVEEDLSLADAARLVHKSPSTVSHLFTRTLGRSFKQTLIETKLRRAEEHMRRNPEISVAQAAASVGYGDPLYFSRIYKRYRGEAPREFLRRCRGE